MEDLIIGVDVGSGSVRAALVSKYGSVLKVAVQNIRTWTPKVNFFQQSSNDIWEACCATIKKVAQDVQPELIKGIGFDATCSLVAIGSLGQPISICPNGEEEQNVIMWMDHRAHEEAEHINKTNHPILSNVGGQISLEMQIPKLMWLKNNLKSQCWDKTDKFFDLPDFLTWKATEYDSRSLCSVVCKWLFECSPNGMGWNKDFLKLVGLDDLLSESNHKIGRYIKEPGEPCGRGLSAKAARELDLLPGTPVATSIIDAHAGALGLIGIKAKNISKNITSRLSLICGTSTCHMALSSSKLYVKGVWGPYFSVMISGLWLNEAGQSVSGKLIDHIIDTHPAGLAIKNKIKHKMRPVDYLNELLSKMASDRNLPLDMLTENLHVWPDFHGNRSPIADSSLKGMISGLDLGLGEEQLALYYLATVQALAYGTRHIMEVMENEGHNFETILVCGGLSKNELFVKSQANAVAKSVLIPREPEAVLLGAAILASTAAGMYRDIETSIENMGGESTVVEPNLCLTGYHNKKYKVFKAMLEHQLLYKCIMQE